MRVNISQLLLVLLLVMQCFSAGRVRGADDWPHFRGPDRDDLSPQESGFDGSWKPRSLWNAQVGEGGSSPIVAGDKVFTIGFDGKGDVVSCRRLADGKVLWAQRYEGPRYGRHSTGDKSLYSGATATPEYDAETDSLYTLSTDGELRCWRARDGDLLWRLNLYDRFMTPRRPDVGGRRSLRDYGYTTSPLVHGSWVIVEVGSRSGNTIAFDKRTGQQLWASECRDEAGHTAGPVPMNVAGVPHLVVLTLRNLVVMSLDADSPGKTIGLAKWTTDFGNNIASPAVNGSSVIVTSAYNQYAMARFDVTKGGMKQRWRTDGAASGVCTPVIASGHVYWAWRGVHCVDFATGKEIWVGGKVGSAGSCIHTKDDRLIVLANLGDLSLVDSAIRSPKKYVEQAALKKQLGSDVWPHMALANGRLLCKDRKGRLRCYDLAPR